MIDCSGSSNDYLGRSHFNVLFSIGDIPVVWNSLSGSTVILSQADAQILAENYLENLDECTRQYLLDRGILTEDDAELQHFLSQRHTQRQLRSPHFRIFTTTACNARCDYCYERGFPALTMTESTAAAVAAFITEKYRTNPLVRTVNLEWFGGEPTLNPTAIHTVTDQLRRKGIPFRSTMITNGLLLTEDLLCHADQWNLKHVQITLDAAEGEYEKIKHLPSGSFTQVLKNINRCLEAGINLSVRIHYTGSPEQVRTLIDILSRQPYRPKVYIAPLYQSERSIPGESMETILALNEELIRSGLMTASEVYNLSQRDRCFCATPCGFTVLPDGSLVNCSHNISPENSFGTLWDCRPDDPLHQKFLSPDLTPECLECPLLPICGGGCPAAQHGLADMHLCIPYRNVISQILARYTQQLL